MMNKKQSKAWDEKRYIIGIPSKGSCDIEFAIRLKQMPVPPKTKIVTSQGYPIDISRNEIVKSAIDQGADSIIWLDDDVIPLDRESLINLAKMEVPVAAGIYFSKNAAVTIQGTHYNPGIWLIGDPNNRLYTPVDLSATFRESSNRYLEVDAIGFGLIKTDIEVFKNIDPPWFRWTQLNKGEDEEGGVSEDFYFCRKLIKAGYKIIVDSMNTAHHLGRFGITPSGDVRPSQRVLTI